MSSLQIKSILALGSNVILAIMIIILNKYLFSELKFNFPVALTAINYAVVWALTELCRRLQLYKQLPKKAMPLDVNLTKLIIIVAFAVPINNLSLNANGVGTYQLLKLLVTPTICYFEYLINGRIITVKRAIALFVASIGVAFHTLQDLKITPAGIFWGMLFLPAAAYYKVHWKYVQSSYGKEGNTLSTIHRIYPYAFAVMLPLVYFCDPPGLLDYEFTSFRVLLLLMSSSAIFIICISSINIMMDFSPLIHQVLGLVKVVASVVVAVVLLGEDRPLVSQVLALIVALVALGVFAWLTTRENIAMEKKMKKIELSGIA